MQRGRDMKRWAYGLTHRRWVVTDEDLLEVIGERGKNRDKIQLLVDTLKNVGYCLDSIVSDDINSKHPSCSEYIANVLGGE
jgi:hypothetical protein